MYFFTAPPLDTDLDAAGDLSHSLRYLADKVRRKAELEKKRDLRNADMDETLEEERQRMKRVNSQAQESMIETGLLSLRMWSERIDGGTQAIYEQMRGKY